MTKLFEELSEEIGKLSSRAKRTDLTTDVVIDSLAFARDATRRLKQEYDNRTKGIKQRLKPFDDAKRGLQKQLDAAEEHFEGDLLKALQDHKELPAETKNGVRLTVAMLPRLGLVDEVKDMMTIHAITDRHFGADIAFYLRPLADCIDWAKVSASIEAGEELRFVAKTEVVSLRTKLPDVIE